MRITGSVTDSSVTASLTVIKFGFQEARIEKQSIPKRKRGKRGKRQKKME